MGNHQTLIHTVQFVVASALIIAIFFMLSLIASTLQESKSQQASGETETSLTGNGSANVITAGASGVARDLQSTARATGDTIKNTTQAIGDTISQGAQSFGSMVASGAKTVGSGIATGTTTVGRTVWSGYAFNARLVGSGVVIVGNGIGTGIVYVANVPAHVASIVTSNSVMSSLVRPSDHVEVPMIDPNSPELKSAVAALPPVQAGTAEQSNAGPQWPMHGAVTTEFGTPHRPYQDTHTGMDISDGQRSGVTPIKPFRPGKVIDVVRSNKGLGNHVTVDHGNGVTSVYAHMYSIAVNIGQDVGLDTVLGTEGTTGVSTGPHLHLEIRVNGQATDPRNFISGNP